MISEMFDFSIKVMEKFGNPELYTSVEFEEKQIVFQICYEGNALTFVPTVDPLQVSELIQCTCTCYFQYKIASFNTCSI